MKMIMMMASNVVARGESFLFIHKRQVIVVFGESTIDDDWSLLGGTRSTINQLLPTTSEY